MGSPEQLQARCALAETYVEDFTPSVSEHVTAVE